MFSLKNTPRVLKELTISIGQEFKLSDLDKTTDLFFGRKIIAFVLLMFTFKELQSLQDFIFDKVWLAISIKSSSVSEEKNMLVSSA